MKDCPDGYQCNEQRCVQCVTDQECPRGEGACEVGRCEEGQCVIEALDAGECPLEDGAQGFCAQGRCVECTSGAQCPAQTCEAALCNERGRCITAPEPDGAPCGPERARVSCGLWGVERPCGICQGGACQPSFGEDCQPDCAQADALCGEWVDIRDCEEGCAYGLLRNDSAWSDEGECCFQAILGPTCND
jgi:hypothetical protein